jgi:hypothetical protein
LARVGIATINPVTPTRTTNTVDGTHSANANLELAPNELDLNIDEVINNAGVQVIGNTDNPAALDLAEDKTQDPLINASIAPADNAYNPLSNSFADQVTKSFLDGGLDNSLITELGILTDPPAGIHLQPDGNANSLHAMTTLDSLFTNNKVTAAQKAANNNGLALLGSMFPCAPAQIPVPSVTAIPSYAYPFDEIGEVAVIMNGEGEELYKYEDPMKTLKSRFPTMDPILRRLTRRARNGSAETHRGSRETQGVLRNISRSTRRKRIRGKIN